MASLRTVLVAALLCIVGPVFLGLSVRNELRARALAEHGVITLADVAEITPDRDTDAGERLAYRFAVDGTTYEGANRHLDLIQLTLAHGLGRIEVRYLPEDPSVSAPTQAATGRTQIMAFFVSIAVTLGGLVLALFVVSTKRRTGRWWV